MQNHKSLSRENELDYFDREKREVTTKKAKVSYDCHRRDRVQKEKEQEQDMTTTYVISHSVLFGWVEVKIDLEKMFFFFII